MRIDQVHVGVTGNGTGYIVTLRDGSETVWTSDYIRLDMKSVKAFTAEIQDALDNASCAICGKRMEYVDHFGHIDTAPDDIMGYCDDIWCEKEFIRDRGEMAWT